MKSKWVAAWLAFFFGIFGVHRFYLGRRFLGIMHLLLFFITFGITVGSDEPFVMVPAILGFIDAVLLMAMPREDFDEKYNAKRLRERRAYARAYEDEYEEPAPKKTYSESFLKKLGIDKFRSGDFDGAVDAFVKALEKGAESPALHFNLACCYSMMHDATSAMEHLEKAIANGFTDLNKIQTHSALHHLREQPGFAQFVANGYRRSAALPAPQENLLDTKPNLAPEQVIDQIFHLGELMEKGLISEEEFQREKQKLLG